MSDAAYQVDKRLVRASFERAAASYDEVAVLQREVGKRLLERLEEVRIDPALVLDIGAGTGVCTGALAARYPRARVIGADFAEAMLHRARARPVPKRFGAGWRARLSGLVAGGRARRGFVAADADRLPFADASVQLLFSNLTLQWCPSLDHTFAEFRRVLAPDGLLLFSTFGPDTLRELRDSWSKADGANHVNLFVDMHDVGDALVRAGLGNPVLDVDRLTLTYTTALELMRELKTLGAHNVTQGRPRTLSSRDRIQAVVDAYEQWRRDGLLPATYEVVYGHAWQAPAGRQRQQQRGDGNVAVPVEQLRREKR